MVGLRQTLKATVVALLSATTIAGIIPTSIDGNATIPPDLEDAAREWQDNPPPTGGALPANATPDQLRWQPALDFDKNGCYNVAAMNSKGEISEGLDNKYTSANKWCRYSWYLTEAENNVYVRSRCNHNWCVHMYAYYFEKDVAVQHTADFGGHRHDWPTIAVWVEGNTTARFVSVETSCWGADKTYWTKYATDDTLFWDGDHIKVVYHKHYGFRHCFRFATMKDEPPENHTGGWYRGPLVDYHTGFPSLELRDKLMFHEFGRLAIPGIKDPHTDVTWNCFEANLITSRKQVGAMKFDPGKDSWEIGP